MKKLLVLLIAATMFIAGTAEAQYVNNYSKYFHLQINNLSHHVAEVSYLGTQAVLLSISAAPSPHIRTTRVKIGKKFSEMMLLLRRTMNRRLYWGLAGYFAHKPWWGKKGIPTKKLLRKEYSFWWKQVWDSYGYARKILKWSNSRKTLRLLKRVSHNMKHMKKMKRWAKSSL